MRKKIGIWSMAALLLAGCYEDKGNYDYHDINEMITIAFDPVQDGITADSVYTYSYPQASVDTMRITYTPIVTQSMASDESRLEYQWIFVGEEKNDTVFSKELTLKYPFQEILTYNPLFRLIDHSTGVEYYRQFQMSTRKPYLNSWYVLHGTAGDRRIGVAEISEEGEVTFTEDAYELAFGKRRFQNATGIFFSAANFSAGYMGYDDGSYLMVYQSDSLTKLEPYMFLTRKDYRQMMPTNMSSLPNITSGIADETGDVNGNGGALLLLDANGKCYWSQGTQGYFFTCKTIESTANYHATMAYIPFPNQDSGTHAIIWDDVNKKFWYYPFCGAMEYGKLEVHPADDAYDTKGDYYIKDENTAENFEEGELSDMTVVAMTEGSTDGFAGVVFYDNGEQQYKYYEVGFTGDKSNMQFAVSRYSFGDLNINANSQFATSYAYPGQIFCSIGGDLYWLNLATGDNRLLYSTTGTITKLKFAVSRNYLNFYFDSGFNNKLAVVVETADGQGEVHELQLEGSGDVSQSIVCTGFGPIADIVFSAYNNLLK